VSGHIRRRGERSWKIKFETTRTRTRAYVLVPVRLDPSGYCDLYLDDDQLAKYAADPTGFAAAFFGLARAGYATWINGEPPSALLNKEGPIE
jgi:hypothetical protein